MWFSAREPGSRGPHDLLPVRVENTPISSPDGSSSALLTVTRAGGRVVDSALVSRGSLAPIWEVSGGAPRTERYAFHGRQVEVTTTVGDSAPRTQEYRHAVPFFTFQELDLVIRSLPFHAGYEASLPLFSEGDDSIEVDTVAVQGRDSADRWTIRFADPAVTGTYVVDGHSRTIVSYEHVFRQDGPMWHAGTVWSRRLAVCSGRR
jgi:hypothetical protein